MISRFAGEVLPVAVSIDDDDHVVVVWRESKPDATSFDLMSSFTE